MNAILIDLDGVIYQGDEAIAGAVETIDWLQKEQIPHLFVTNTSSRPLRLICQRLESMGIEVDPKHVFTPVIAASNWLKMHTDGPCAFLVPDVTLEDFKGIPILASGREEGCSAIIVGDLGRRWDFEQLNRAFRLLMGENRPPLIALGMTRYWHAADGLRLDVAPFVKALEFAVGCEALVLGKPSETFFNQALELLSISAEHGVMIGDDIKGDVAGAQSAGLKGVLVRTGKYRPSDLEGDIVPDAVLDSIADLPRWWGETTID